MEVPTASPEAERVSSWVHWLGLLAASCAAAALAVAALCPIARLPEAAPEAAPSAAPPLETSLPEQALPDQAPLTGPLPELLSETGLYAGSGALHPDVLEFSPQYPLWSDGASKRRFLRLPPGLSIDGSEPSAWVFPVGTRFWKEFSFGRQVETRYIERQADGSWRFASYAWDEGGREARLVPERGRLRVASLPQTGLEHDVPSRGDCLACHEGGGQRAPVLGFTALQLASERDARAPHAELPAPGAVDLEELLARGLLRGYPKELAGPRIAARSETERAALGYLHANCAGCHNAHGPLADLGLDLEQTGQTGDAARVLASVVSAPSRFRLPGHERSARVVPGNAAQSVLHFRLSSRQLAAQMPPLGSKVVDQEATELVSAWIAQLNPSAPLGAPQENP